ncbi:hypothetical protein [Hyalangium rubrum]|uniref:Uncharacterized protein n=1 Tax=Hyalangium rubrum TaxID=3103134 RepID=A0ABU5H7R8_9BACT|nr:hypothetical protein [Hyalangium sp. s54d21]MDY7228807.1 hypothetical protein [Hyalangium sp. s54d21]
MNQALPAVRILPPSRALLDSVRQELGENLPPEHRPLLGLLSLSDFLTVATVLHQERAVGRLILPMERVRPTMEAIGALGLYVRRGAIDFVEPRGPVEGTDHARHELPSGTPGATHGMFYFGVAEDLLEGADVLEQTNQHAMLASLFGYPECCVQLFTRTGEERLDKTPDSIPDLGPFPRLMNPCLRYLFGFQLIFHFPCSPRCERSRTLLEGRLAYLKRHAPSAAGVAALGTGITLYGPRTGVALVTRSRQVAEQTFEVEEVVAAGSKLPALLAHAPSPVQLTLHGAHAFELGGVAVEDVHAFVARYE